MFSFTGFGTGEWSVLLPQLLVTCYLLLLFELMNEILIIPQVTLEIAEVKQNGLALSTAPNE